MYKNTKTVSADEAVKVLKSGDHVHLSSVASVPQNLVEAMCRRGDAGELRDVHIHHLHTEGAAPYTEPRYEGIFQHDAFLWEAMYARTSRRDMPITSRCS